MASLAACEASATCSSGNKTTRQQRTFVKQKVLFEKSQVEKLPVLGHQHSPWDCALGGVAAWHTPSTGLHPVTVQGTCCRASKDSSSRQQRLRSQSLAEGFPVGGPLLARQMFGEMPH